MDKKEIIDKKGIDERIHIIQNLDSDIEQLFIDNLNKINYSNWIVFQIKNFGSMFL